MLLWHGGVSQAPPTLPVAPVAAGRDVSWLFLLFFVDESFTLVSWRVSSGSSCWWWSARHFAVFMLLLVALVTVAVLLLAMDVGQVALVRQAGALGDPLCRRVGFFYAAV